jgi:Large polyvalent protein associated domain 38
MASDFTRIQENVQAMVDQSAPAADINGYLSTEGFKPQEFKLANENYGSFTSAVKRGGKGIGSLIADVLPAMGADLFSKIAPESFQPAIQAYKEKQMGEAQKTQEEIAKKYPGQYESYKDVEGVGDALGYVKEAIGENLASFLPGLLTGGVGTIASRGAVLAAGELAAAQFAKQSLGKATQAELLDVAKSAMAKKALQYEVGSTMVGSAALNVPEAYQSVYDPANQETLLPALASGAFNTVLDAITPINLLRTMKGKGITGEAIAAAWYKRGAKELGKGVLTESTTESLQEMSNAKAEQFIKNNPEFFTPENLTRFIDAGLKGGIGGGVIQGATGVVFGKGPQPEAPPAPPAGVVVPPTAPVKPLEPLPAPYTKLTGERDIAGVVPEGRLPSDRIPIVDPKTGKVTGYQAAAPGPQQELQGTQTALPLPGQQELLTGVAPAQPEQTAAAPMPPTEPIKPIGQVINDTLTEARKDPTASKILKGNNAASARIVSERLQGFMGTPDADPAKAMEELYAVDKSGKYPTGTKPLSEAQNELLQTVYRRATGQDIEEAIKARAFAGAQQADLFAQGEQNVPSKGEPQPTTGAAGADVGVPGEPNVGPSEGAGAAGVGGVGVGGSGTGLGGLAGGEGTKPAALTPEEAWAKHKNDDHPDFGALNPEEQAAWAKAVEAGRSNAANFQDLVQEHEARVARETKKTPEQVKKIFEEEFHATRKSIENEVAGKSYDELLDFMVNNGPAAMREVMSKVKASVDRMKQAGYKFTFTVSQSPEQSNTLGLSRKASGHVSPSGKTMNLVLAGANSGRHFGAEFYTAAHELLHSVTIPLIREGEMRPESPAGKIVQELKDLSKHVKRELRKRQKNGTASGLERALLVSGNAFGKKVSGAGTIHIADEMVSWGMTYSPYREILESIPYKGKSVMDAFVELVRKLIGLGPKENTALSEIIRLSGELFDMRLPENVSATPPSMKFESEATNIAAAPGPSVVPAPGQPYTLPKTSKLQDAQTAGQKTAETAKKIANAWNDDSFWTKFRIAAIDPTSGLAKTLSSLPIFQNGQLRADMLVRSFSQVINLIKNGLQSGVPMINSDGTVVILRSENNMARSQLLADLLDKNPIVNGSGLSGRGYIAEIARIKRGEEVMLEDLAVREEARKKMQSARDKVTRAKQLRATGGSLTEILKLVNEAKAIRAQWRDALTLNREKQITKAHIQWANEQMAAVPEVQAVFDIWRNINMALIDLNEASGNFSREKADKYRSKKYYVPLYASRVDLGPEKQETYTGARTGTKSVAKEYHLEGSDLQRNIWENMDKYYAAATASAFQNQTRKIAVQQLMSGGIDAARFAKQDDPNVNLRYRDPTSEHANKDGVVSVILDNPNDLAAFQMLHYELNPLMKGLSATTQVLRAGALINPMYWIKQLIRDPIHASLVANAGIVTPFHAAKEYINILANNSEEARILASRGVIGQVDSTIDLHKFLQQVGTEKMDPSRMQKMFHKVMQMHEASDAATRVAIYKQVYAAAIKQGLTKQDATNLAVHKARESINFSVRGNSRTLNTLRHAIPFFSAALTSLDTVYRAATGYGLNPIEKKAAQTLFAKRAAMMTMLSVAYALMLQDDEDYKKLPDNVKDNNWLLPSPVGDERSFLKVPVPFEIGFLFKTLPEASVRYMSGTSTGKEVVASILGGIRHNLPGEGVPLPQALKPGLEAVTNYSFFTGRAIEGMSDQGLPVAARGPNASEFAKSLSSFGLDKIGLSPAKIDYLIQGYTAELGATSANIASGLVNMATGKEPPDKNLEQQPFFKSFLTNPNTSKAASDYYDLAHNAQEAVNYVNRMKKEGHIAEAKEYMSDEEHKKLVAAAPSYRRIGDQMAKVRAEINRIKDDPNRTSEAKKDEINRLQIVYDRIARQGYKVAEAAGVSR